jgi:hypothetical protein
MSIAPETPTKLTRCNVELPSPPCTFRDVPPIDEIVCRIRFSVGFQRSSSTGRTRRSS